MALTKTLKIGNATFNFATKTSELTNDSNFVNQLKTVNGNSLIGTGNIEISEGGTQVQSDWNVTDTTSMAYIQNKPDLSQFITNTADNLTNYYTKTTIDGMIGSIVTMSIVVVNELPSSGADKTIYLVKKSKEETSNVYDEYLWINGKFEKIGDTSVDLSNYYTKSEADAKFLTEHQSLAGYATEQWVNNKGYSTFSGSYNDLTNKPTIPSNKTTIVATDTDGNTTTINVYTE